MVPKRPPEGLMPYYSQCLLALVLYLLEIVDFVDGLERYNLDSPLLRNRDLVLYVDV